MERDSGASVYEFFAGGGMARLGLASAWRIAFANDIDPAKTKAYAAAFGRAGLRTGDVWDLEVKDMPGRAGLAWASFPCQDLSLAGPRKGLDGPRSGAFWGFWRLIEGLQLARRAPQVLALENVTGLLTSNGGRDFAVLCETLTAAGYHAGAMELDAAWFVPQSRERLFIVASLVSPPANLQADMPDPAFHSSRLISIVKALPPAVREKMVWWRLPAPPTRNTRLIEMLDDEPCGVCWNSAEKTTKLISMMAPPQKARLDQLLKSGGRHAGALYRRIRLEDGQKVQRAEARFDGVAGCIRTPAGGSSKQTLVLIENGQIRTRLLSARESARLMGLEDTYPLPESQTAALHLIGDGVCPPVVRWLSAHLLEPLAGATPQRSRTPARAA